MATPVPAAVEADNAWLDEIDLDPEGAWLRMGTRNLGAHPWLVLDSKRSAELELKDRLLRERPDEVFAAEDGSEPAANEVLTLVIDALSALPVLPDGLADDRVAFDGPLKSRESLHPLDRAGRLLQEDLCLLRPAGDGTWVLGAASLCFPSRWRLATKMGRGLNAVHAPVPGYDPSLNSRVDSLMTRLASRASSGTAPGASPSVNSPSVNSPSVNSPSVNRLSVNSDRVVWRRNWFIHPDPSLFQPDRPAVEPVVRTEACLDELYVRSERQTLRALGGSGWILFTIRTQQASLRTVTASEDRHRALVSYISDASADLLGHRGVDEPQRQELLDALR